MEGRYSFQPVLAHVVTTSVVIRVVEADAVKPATKVVVYIQVARVLDIFCHPCCRHLYLACSDEIVSDHCRRFLQ